MIYKLCPKCGLRYIPVDEEYCDTCKNSDNGNGRKSRVETDFSHIVYRGIYGSNSRKIYDEFCKNLGWDEKQAGKFGPQKPLYAANADTYRKNDVWFICYPNYDAYNRNTANTGHNNLIIKNGEKIIETVQSRIGISNNANRITFVKTKNGYEFFGVYKLVRNGTTREFTRISKYYPF